MHRSDYNDEDFVWVDVEEGNDYLASDAGWTYNRRCPLTGKFIKKGVTRVKTDSVISGAITVFLVDDTGESHAHAECEHVSTIVREADSELGTWPCGCIHYEIVNHHSEEIHKATKEQIIVNQALDHGPISVADLAKRANCSKGRVYEVIKSEDSQLVKTGSLVSANCEDTITHDEMEEENDNHQLQSVSGHPGDSRARGLYKRAWNLSPRGRRGHRV